MLIYQLHYAFTNTTYLITSSRQVLANGTEIAQALPQSVSRPDPISPSPKSPALQAIEAQQQGTNTQLAQIALQYEQKAQTEKKTKAKAAAARRKKASEQKKKDDQAKKQQTNTNTKRKRGSKSIQNETNTADTDSDDTEDESDNDNNTNKPTDRRAKRRGTNQTTASV